jgi:hypothetical protein
MKLWTVTVLAAAVVASGAIAQNKEAYNLKAATEDLAVFHRLARDGALQREDARSDLNFGARFDQADLDRDGMVTAAEMDRYIKETYGVSSASAGAGNATDAYRLHAATRDLEAFLQLARGGALRREDARGHPVLGERFDHADANRDGVITAQEMDRYIQQTYGIVSATAPSKSGSASAGSGTRAAPAPAGNSAK